MAMTTQPLPFMCAIDSLLINNFQFFQQLKQARRYGHASQRSPMGGQPPLDGWRTTRPGNAGESRA